LSGFPAEFYQQFCNAHHAHDAENLRLLTVSFAPIGAQTFSGGTLASVQVAFANM